MGEAKRRRDYERAHAEEIAADLDLRREQFELIEAIGAEDVEDQDPRLGERLREINQALGR